MPIITVTSQKGGVTKTTTTISLAHALATQGHSTLIVDADPQGNAATSLGFDPEPGVYEVLGLGVPPRMRIIGTNRPLLDLLPGNQSTKSLIARLSQRLAAGEIDRSDIATSICELTWRHNFVVIDTPASGILQEAALLASEIIIILPTLRQASRESAANLDMLTGAYPDLVATSVPASAAVREAIASGRTIWEHEDRGSRTLPEVRRAYEALAARVTQP